MPDSSATEPPPSAGWPVGSDEPKWRNRGASPASWTSMPKSIILQITCTCPWACMSPPISPKLSQGWPSLVTKPGMIVWNGRFRGSSRLRWFGSSAKRLPRFCNAKPRSPGTWYEPKPWKLLWIRLTQLKSRSTTVM